MTGAAMADGSGAARRSGPPRAWGGAGAMQRRVIEQLEPGMTLAMPIRHPARPGAVLVRPGVQLSRKAIERLDELRLNHVWVEMAGTSRVDEYVSGAVNEVRYGLIVRLREEFKELREGRRAGVSFPALRGMTDRLMGLLGDQPTSGVLSFEADLPGEPLVRSAVNACFIAATLGRRLEPYLIRERPKVDPKHAADVSGLVVAALLHDVGLNRLEEHVLDHWLRTHDETDTRWRRHVRLGYEMLRGLVDPSAAAAVLNHHQAYDGSGFPCRLGASGEAIPRVGREVHVFSRVLSAIETFERLRFAPGADRPAPTVRALRAMLSGEVSARLDPEVVAGLVQVAPPFPPGARVRLSNGEHGTVVGLNASDPCRPAVRIETPGAAFEAGAREDGAGGRAVTADASGEREGAVEGDGGGAVAGDGGDGAGGGGPALGRLVDLSSDTELVIVEIDGVGVSDDLFSIRRAGPQNVEQMIGGVMLRGEKAA